MPEEVDYEFDQELSSTQVAREQRETPCELVTGCAGTGKTFAAVRACKEDDSYGVLSATTGIAAVNLGAITVHALLRYSTTEVLRDHYLTGRLQRVLHPIAKRYRWLIVDEVSMCDGDQLDLWYRGVEQANGYADVDQPLGIKLIADFAQLPPVKAKWAFEAACWDRFQANTTRLTKVFRQDSGKFLDALNLTRRGEGAAAAELLLQAGARFETQLDTQFEGTTILPKNDMVARYNAMALDRVKGEKFRVTSRRWGKQQPEWGQNVRTKEWGIPLEVELKVGAYVMILANAPDFEFVNGDCGWVEEHVPESSSGGTGTGWEKWLTSGTTPEHLVIRLVRNGRTVAVPKIVRGVEFSDRPEGYSGVDIISKSDDTGAWRGHQHFRGRVRRYVMGQVEYFPVRLAYATSVHKSQSLTLDKVQVDYRDRFFGMPAMMYVALSRCRTLEGLRLVGQKEKFAQQCCYDPKVKEWL